MNKYINTFATSGDYETYKASSALSTPNVAYIEDSKEVKWLNSKKDLYNIFGTLIGDSATAKISINNKNYTVSPSGADNEFGLVFSQPVTDLFFFTKEIFSRFEKINIDTSSMQLFNELFYNCENMTFIDLTHLDTSSAISMNGMFSNCKKIETLDISNFKTSSVNNMAKMFRNCNRLTTLDVSNWNTEKVTNMNSMFNSCNSLTTLDLSNFNTSAVTNMNTMFDGCGHLATLDLSNFDTSAVTNMSYMFRDCPALTTVTMDSTSEATFDMIKAQLVTDSMASHVTIIRDGVNWKYQNGAWVEA